MQLRCAIVIAAILFTAVSGTVRAEGGAFMDEQNPNQMLDYPQPVDEQPPIEYTFANGLWFREKLTERKMTNLLVVHHTAAAHDTVDSIHTLHLKNGWAGIGYHKVIYPDGSLHEGRPEKTVGAHAFKFNDYSVGIALVGNFDVTTPSEMQLETLVSLTQKLLEQYHLKAEQIVPHRAVTQTDCPGKNFPWEQYIRLVKDNDDNKVQEEDQLRLLPFLP